MTVATGLVFFAIVWTVIFFVLNPLWQVSQGESGEDEPGTPESAPVDAMVLKKAAMTTVGVAAAALIAPGDPRIANALLVTLGSWVVLERGILTLEDVSWITPPSMR